MATIERNRVWSDSVLFWQDVVSKSPRKDRGYPHLTHAYMVSGRCEEAVKHLERLSTVLPRDYFILFNWARAYECGHKTEAALQKVNEALRLSETSDAYGFMGEILSRKRRMEEAQQAFVKAVALEPSGTDLAHVYRGHLLSISGKLADAEQEYGRALAVNPYSPEAAAALVKIRNASRRGRTVKVEPHSEYLPLN